MKLSSDIVIGIILIIIGLIFGSLGAQTLTPVATSSGLSVWHVVAIGGVVLALAVAGWYYGIHKRGKDAEAGVAVDKVVERVADLIHHDKQPPPVQPPMPSGSPTAAQSAAPSTAVPPWEQK